MPEEGHATQQKNVLPKYLPPLLSKRGVDPDAAMLVLDRLQAVVQSIDADFCSDMQQQAWQRIAVRDADDWPILACAMILGCPVWTEDADFFGTGVPTWTTDRIALYFS
ncbi:MAG: PIN domain-containing protein [Hydrogenophaga sp.]|nr:PIN domain-containing protein [Hydrogenophaga sp.]